VLVILLKGKIMPRIKKANPMQNPNNPDYINYLYGMSGNTPDYIKQKNSPDPRRPYSYNVFNSNEAQWNRDDYNRGQSAPPKQPKPRKQAPADGYIKQDAWTPDYITNRVYGAMEPDMMEQLMYMYNQLPANGVSSMYDLPPSTYANMANQMYGGMESGVDALSNQYGRLNRLLTRNGYNNTTGRPRSQVTPNYVQNRKTSNQYLDTYYDTVGRPRSQVTPDYIFDPAEDTKRRNQTRLMNDYNNTTGRPRSQVTPDYLSNPMSKRKSPTKRNKY